MKQNIDLIDSETGFKFRIESAAEVLTKDITIVVPDDDNAVLATSKQVENLRTGLTNGSITVRNAETVGDKQANAFALADLSNVNLSGIGGNTLLYGGFIINTPSIPATNNFIDFLSTPHDGNTFPTSRKIDNNKFLLKAGSTYNIRGAILSLNLTSGTLQLAYKFYSVANNTELTPTNGSFVLYQSPEVNMRRFTADVYVKFEEDVYLRLKVTTNSLSGGVNLSVNTLISEYSSVNVSLERFTINGKTFDNNNNVDLEGLSTLSNYNLAETLTEKRWIDGKPIYRKVIQYAIGSTAPTADITVPTGIANGELAWVDGFKLVDNTYVTSESNTYYTSDTGENRILCTKDGSNVLIKLANNSSALINNTYYITVEYTKVTDTAQSPVRLVGSGNGTTGIVNELPALTGSEGKLLKVNENGSLEWFDNSFVGCSVISNLATTLTANTVGKIKFTVEASSKVFDTHSGFDYVNSKFVAPIAGYYDVLGKVAYNTSGYNRAQIYKNGVNFRIGGDSNATHSFINDVVFLDVGDTIELYGFSSVANTTQANNNTYLTVTLKK